MEALLEYRELIIVLALAGVYFLVIRPRLKIKVREDKGPVYVCDQCGDHDCHCHKLEEPEN